MDDAMKRIDVIRSYWNGELSGQQAAQELKVSVPTFHKWEKRALSALVDSQMPRQAGRPKKPEIDRQKQDLKKALLESEKRMLAMDLAMEINDRLSGGSEDPKKKRRKKKGS